jgi:tRNA pseudouridine38-40 synthase
MVLSRKSPEQSEGSGLNIKLIIEYDGKNYSGWQKQNSNSSQTRRQNSIQETIEDTLRVLFPKENIKLTGAGRTDAGVHALGQTANFKISKSSLTGRIKDLNKLVYSLNAILPEDITVKKARLVKEDFHARYSAKKRIYRYLITTEKRSYNADKLFHIKTKFDIDLAKDYCKLIVGTHSFESMCKNREDKHRFMSTVYYAIVKKRADGVIEFKICASRFLHSMVRAITGMMIKIASGKINLNEFKNKFEKGEPLKIQYVPSNALILEKIIY